MPVVVTINNAEVVRLIEQAAAQFTGGNKTAAVALALTRLLESQQRTAPLFGAHAGSGRVKPGVDLMAPVLEDTPDAELFPWAVGPRARAAGASRGRGRRASARP